MKRKIAVGLSYDEHRDPAPKLVAKGFGKFAEKIIEAAKHAGVPIEENPDLAALLARGNLFDYIPATLFEAVAEVLAYIYVIDAEATAQRKRTEQGK